MWACKLGRARHRTLQPQVRKGKLPAALRQVFRQLCIGSRLKRTLLPGPELEARIAGASRVCCAVRPWLPTAHCLNAS